MNRQTNWLWVPIMCSALVIVSGLSAQIAGHDDLWPSIAALWGAAALMDDVRYLRHAQQTH